MRRPRPLPELAGTSNGLHAPWLPRSASAGALSGLRSLIRSGSRSHPQPQPQPRKPSSAAPSADTAPRRAKGAGADPPMTMWKRVRDFPQSSRKLIKHRHTVSSSSLLALSENGDASQPQSTPKVPDRRALSAAEALSPRHPSPQTAGAVRSPESVLSSNPKMSAPTPCLVSHEDAGKSSLPLDRLQMIQFPITAASRPQSWTTPGLAASAHPPNDAVPSSSTPPPHPPAVSLPSQLGIDPSPVPGSDGPPGQQAHGQASSTQLEVRNSAPHSASTEAPGTSYDTSAPEQPMDGNQSAGTGKGYAISPKVVANEMPYHSMRQRSLVSSDSSTPRVSMHSLPAPPREAALELPGSTASDSSSAGHSPKSQTSVEPVAEDKRAGAHPRLAPPQANDEATQQVSPTPPPPYSLRTASAASSRMREQLFVRNIPAGISPLTPTVVPNSPVPSHGGSRSRMRRTTTSFSAARLGTTLESSLVRGEPALRPIESGLGELGPATDAVSTKGSENTIQNREEEVSVVEVENTLSIVEAALAEHDVEGSFDVSLLRPLSAPTKGIPSGSRGSARTSKFSMAPLSDEKRRKLNPDSSQALTQAVQAVRQALGPSPLVQPGLSVRRDVEEAYARMLALVAQATDEISPSTTSVARSSPPVGQGMSADMTDNSNADRDDLEGTAPALPHAGSSERFFPSGGGSQDRTRAVVEWARYSAYPEGGDDDAPQRRFTSDPRRRSDLQALSSADATKLAGRHRLETESLLDALELAQATASEVQRERATLQRDLRLEVTRVLQLERALSQTHKRAEDAEARLERAEDQLRLEREAQAGLKQQLEQLTSAWPRSGSEPANLGAVPAEKLLPVAGGRRGGVLPDPLSTDTAARFLLPVENVEERDSRSPSPLLETKMPDVPTIDDTDLPPPSGLPCAGARRPMRWKPSGFTAIQSRIPRGQHLRTFSGSSLRKVSSSTAESSFTARSPSSVGGEYVYDRLGRGYYDPHRPTGYSALDMPHLHREIFDSSIDEAF